MSIIDGGHAEDVRLGSDENGFELYVDTPHGTYAFNVHGVVESFLDIGKQIDDYFAEGARLAREHPGEVVSIGDESGYELSDPKHPTYHERMTS